MDTDRLLLVRPHNFGWPWGQGLLQRLLRIPGRRVTWPPPAESRISVDILDAPFHGWGLARTVKEIKDRRFDVLGISANWQEFFPQCAAMLERLSDIRAPIILGGHFPTIARQELLRDFPMLSAICMGEGEVTLVETMEALASGRSLQGQDVASRVEVPGLALQSHETPRRPDR